MIYIATSGVLVLEPSMRGGGMGMSRGLIAGSGGFAGLVSGRRGSSCTILVGRAELAMCRILIWIRHFPGFWDVAAGIVTFNGIWR